ncbi:MAG: folate-binding protein YgfZ [Opitutae bacterium]|nr:folate-binding protein YgfZ [Opitutae bacterium]
MDFYIHNNELNKTSAVFRIRGPDANTYLQGQFTQDISGPIGAISYGLWLNQKGKILADSHVLRLAADEFLVISYSTTAPALRERLESYLIADDVTLQDETVQWERVVFAAGEGEFPPVGVERPVAGRFLGLPSGALVFAGRWFGPGSCELLVPLGGAPGILDAMQSVGATHADDSAANRHRILAGVPAIPADLGPNDLPQEGGLDEVAISYTKGCFLGQEVMARIKNLGQVRRALHIVRGRGPAPAASASLYQTGQRVGEVRSVAPEGNGFVAMAMLSLVNYRPSQALGATSDGAPDIEVLRRV